MPVITITQDSAKLLEDALRKRAISYPAIGDQLDSVLKGFQSLRDSGSSLPGDLNDILDDWESVKQEYPKPESLLTVEQVTQYKLQELKAYRNNNSLPHRTLMYSGAVGEINPALPVIVRKGAIDGANNCRDRMAVNAISEVEWYFDDGDDTTQRTELILSSGAMSQLLKALVDRDMDIRRMYHKKEAEILALSTVEEIEAYDVSANAADGTSWPS